jgi:broad specificity phosphatase PhoE
LLTIYLTRHGQTEWNVQKRMQGWGNGELTDQGRQDALALAKRLKDVKIDAVYASSSKRAYETAEIIVGDREIPIIKDDLLREMHFGDWEGRTRDEIEREYPEAFKAFWETPHLFDRGDGEVFSQVQERAKLAFQKIIEQHKEGTVLVVSHSIFLRVLIAYIRQLPLEKLFTQTPLGHTSLTKVVIKDDLHHIEFEGDTSHLNK